MDQPLIEALAQRVDSVERENRRLRRAGAVALAGAVAMVIAGAKGADGPKVVEAERFVLRGEDGLERGWLRINAEGTASLSVQDKGGRGGVSLVVPADGGKPYLDVWNREQGHLMLHVGEDRLALDILDKDRKGLVALKVEDVNGDRTDYLSFVEADKGQVNLGLHEDGSGGLAITRHSGERRTELWQQADGGPVLRVFDEKGKPLVQIPPP